jgi:hypothetical protein
LIKLRHGCSFTSFQPSPPCAPAFGGVIVYSGGGGFFPNATQINANIVWIAANTVNQPLPVFVANQSIKITDRLAINDQKYQYLDIARANCVTVLPL